ncbi:MAG: DNA-3-methyladenine glycosylase [Candidatus Dormiibacterota bacterium]|jgi:DNA-3-methyladenine glycosylase
MQAAGRDAGSWLRLPRGFFARNSPVVARELLGCWMVRQLDNRVLKVRVSETEAYLGPTDPASHAFRGRTRRNAPMFGPAGIAYVYFIYGMHYCFNVVTGQEGDPQAVLIRGGVSGPPAAPQFLRGPAILCRALGIDLGVNGADLCAPGLSRIWFELDQGWKSAPRVTSRVGVRDQRPLRFLDASISAPEPDHTSPQRKRAPKGSLIG